MQAADGAVPVGSAWAFEFDWTGRRAVAYLHPERLRLLSGNSERPISREHPGLAALSALAERRGEMVLDGTITTADPGSRGRRAGHQERFCVSDVLHIDGGSTLELPYLRRRELLAGLDLEGLPAFLTPYHVDVDGEQLLRIAAEYGLPGVLAKRLQAPYLPGRRSARSWIRIRVPRSPDGAEHPAAPAPVARDAPVADPVALDEAVRLAQAEARALRAQISQHFLYNALNTVRSYVRTDPTRARDLLADFAEYTRYSFRTGPAATTLGAELANVERYLALEQARFDDRLRVTREVEDGLLDTVLPFLTVQPLVEHAVRHGIEGTPSGGTLHIAARRDGADCVITVSEDVGPEDVGAAGLTELAADLRARLLDAGHPAGGSADLVRVRVDDRGSSVTLRVPRAG
jgi:hypothetical protein